MVGVESPGTSLALRGRVGVMIARPSRTRRAIEGSVAGVVANVALFARDRWVAHDIRISWLAVHALDRIVRGVLTYITVSARNCAVDRRVTPWDALDA